MRARYLLALLGVLVLTLGAGSVAADGLTDIGTDHDVASDEAMGDWAASGYADGEADRYQLDIAVAEKRADVGAEDAVVTNLRNHFLRLDYQEDHPRELRVLLPRDVITPYQAESIGSLTSDHEADIKPAQSGEYLSVTVSVDGPADIVIPLNRDHALSYTFLERTDQRIQELTGFSPLDRDAEWAYVEGDEIAEGGTYQLNLTGDDLAVQYDATPESSDETWLNVPRGETVSAPIYVLEYDENQYTLVATTDKPPDVRHRDEATLPAQVRGWLSEAGEIPNNIRDRVTDLLPWGDG